MNITVLPSMEKVKHDVFDKNNSAFSAEEFGMGQHLL
jgi:hypothetical protein